MKILSNINMELAPLQFSWVDCWPRNKLDKVRMSAYKAFDNSGTIKIHKLIYSKAEQMVSVVFSSAIPVEWFHQELAEEVKRNQIAAEREADQISFFT